MLLNNFINNPHLRIFLFPLALFYWGIIYWRNIFYNLGIFVSYSLPCKVVSVGNITTGGTGKTPAVIYFAKLFKKYGCRDAVLSRGHGRTSKVTIDLNTKNLKTKNWKSFGEEPPTCKANGFSFKLNESSFFLSPLLIASETIISV